MTDDLPDCTCGDLTALTRLGLEGQPIPGCQVHRPNADAPQRAPLALNSDDLSSYLAEALGGTTQTTDL